MNCTIPTLNINLDDCVGDSLGKHNYNSLVLDTNICNLSSILFNNSDNLNTFFTKFSAVVSEIISVNDYTENKINPFLATTTSVNLLSSYWNNYQFSIQYPINGSQLYGRNFIDAPALFNTDPIVVDNFIENKLKPLASRHLLKNFAAENFPDGSVVNVIFFIYNYNPNPSSTGALNRSSVVPNNFNYKQRVIKAKYSRESIYFRTSIILKYSSSQINNLWTYFDKILGEATSTLTTTEQHLLSAAAIKPAVVTAGKCFPIKFNTWYNVVDYYSVISYAHGRNHKRKALRKFGTLTVSFSSHNGVQKFSHKAGQNGGCDTYLEWNQSNVIASEYNPIVKTITNIWTAPFSKLSDSEISKMKFKFTRDNRALTYYVCGSDKVVM